MKTQIEKFEEFWKEKILDAGWVLSKMESYFVWKRAWQAAIESATVQLPEPHQDEWKELNLSTDEVVKAFDDAGVKYVLPETFVRY